LYLIGEAESDKKNAPRLNPNALAKKRRGFGRPRAAADGRLMTVQTFWSACCANCGSCCPLKLCVEDGRLIRIEAHQGEKDAAGEALAVRACQLGRSFKELVYAPDRLTVPLRRLGPRGSGRFEPVSWETAWDELAAALRDVLERDGNEAVHQSYGTGTINCTLNAGGAFPRLMNLLGGHLEGYNSYSSAQISAAAPFLYGAPRFNPPADVADSRLLLMFGENTLETQASGGGASRELLEALKKSRAKVIVVDPRLSDTAAALADRWIPVRPGSDGALALALAHELIRTDLIDADFLARCVVGYDDRLDSFKNYVLGGGPDARPKTPRWAAEIAGCPAEVIEELAQELGRTKPAFIVQGLGPQRQAGGEATALAIMALAVLTGNVGLPGGNGGGPFEASGPSWPAFPVGVNPVKTKIPVFAWARAVRDGPALTSLDDGVRGAAALKTSVKFLWNCASNVLMNQHSELAAVRRLLADPARRLTVATVDVRLTPTARMSDYVLPSLLPPESDEIFTQGWGMSRGLYLATRAALKPPGQALSQHDIAVGLARRLGVERAFAQGLTAAGWLDLLHQAARQTAPQLPPTRAAAVEHGPYVFPPPSRRPALADFRADPGRRPLPTPSGKIELFSERLAELGRRWRLPAGEAIRPLPERLEVWEGPTAQGLPLQLIGHHFKGRIHSSFAGLKNLGAAHPQRLWMNPLDAQPRGLAHGDLALVFNDRGRVLARVKVTERVMPGVVSLPQGAWHDPDREGLDRGGCVNALTRDRPSPLAKGNPQHTNRVEAVKADEAADGR
jgi:DmsA/YnfE family anaerobic dimethyl sulfoxide reductase A subunit